MAASSEQAIPGHMGMEVKRTFVLAQEPCSSFYPQWLSGMSYCRVHTQSLGSQSKKLHFLLFPGPQQGHVHSPSIPIGVGTLEHGATWQAFSNQLMFLSPASLLSHFMSVAVCLCYLWRDNGRVDGVTHGELWRGFQMDGGLQNATTQLKGICKTPLTVPSPSFPCPLVSTPSPKLLEFYVLKVKML